MIGQTFRHIAIGGAVILTALPSLAASAAEPVRSLDIVESSAFLEGYRLASEAHSADFYDLYSDRAVVHMRIRDHEQGVAFQGRAFKVWGRQLLKEGRATPDGSIFHDATVEQRGTRLLIRAKRYSTSKCYWDLDYQVGIEREGLAYRIVDELLTTQPAGSCRSTHTPIHASASTALQTPVDYTLSTTSGAFRAPDSEGTTPWRPLSQQQLADQAMALARQLAVARASQSTVNVNPRALILGPLGREDVASDLRVTPEP